MFNGSRGELGVGDEAPIDDSLDAGLNFGEWFSSALNEYILDQSMINKTFSPCNTPAWNAISQATKWTHIDRSAKVRQILNVRSTLTTSHLHSVYQAMLYAFHWSRGPRQRLKRPIVKLKYILPISTHHQFRRFISLPWSIKQRNFDKQTFSTFPASGFSSESVDKLSSLQQKNRNKWQVCQGS